MSILRKIKNTVTGTVKLFIPDHHIFANVSVLAPNNLLKGRIALVTGGTSGIGYAIAKAFLQAGASVVITSRDETKAIQAAIRLRPSAQHECTVLGIKLDNTKPNEFEPQIKNVEGLIGKIDILVNNAGIQGAQFGTATEKEYDAVMNTNLKGTFFLSQLVARRMVDCEIKGNILNICSSSSLRPAANAYTISKVALKELTEGMAKTLVRKGIIVNGLAPGPTATPMLHRDGKDDISCPHNPLGRYALPEEIASMAVILCSGLATTIVGSVVYMTGGAGILTYEDVKYPF